MDPRLLFQIDSVDSHFADTLFGQLRYGRLLYSVSVKMSVGKTVFDQKILPAIKF